MTSFDRLLSPLRVGRRELRNRVVVTAHTTFNIDEEHLPDERDVAYFAERARGGAALLTMGTTAVHASSPTPYGIYANLDDRIRGPYERLAAAVHEHGALIVPQLGHMAQRTDGRPGAVWSPSTVAYQSAGRIPHAMTKAEIREVVAAFASAARRAVDSGMDGVEVAVGHGQLLNLFCSPLTNRRTDEYGGSFDNRLRFALEVLEAVRAAIGTHALVSARVNATDLVDGSLTETDWLAIDEAIDASGLVDVISVSVDFHGSQIPTMATEHACWVPYAAEVRKRVAVPVCCVGRITDPEVAEAVLADGHADLVGMTRAHIADPHLVRKLRQDRRADVRPCIGCVQMCVGELFRGRNVKCVHNAVTGHERTRAHLERERAPHQRKVVVVGGGPAGMEAARVAALRGHDVTLLERERALGGTVRLAAKPPTRGEIGRVADWLATQLARLAVAVRLGVDADRETVLALAPDVVVVATGALGATPPWGEGSARVLSARALLADEVPLSGTVAVIDDEHRGQGLAVAAYLLERACVPVVVSDAPAVGELLERETRAELYRYVLGAGGRFAPLTRCAGAVDVVADEVELLLVDSVTGERRRESYDWVVTTWAQPADALVEALRDHVDVHVVGDALSPHRIEAAVHSAFVVAASL